MSPHPDIDARLGEILEVLLAIARQDFQARAAVSGAQDTLDAIAAGLNMLAEELHAETASRQELERAHAELKQTQSRLIHAGKLAAVGQLASGVAHEINNPAMSLEVAVAILKRACDDVHVRSRDDPRLGLAALLGQIDMLRSALDDAREAVQRIRSLTGDLRTFARADHERKELVALDEVARVCCRLAAPMVRPRAELLLNLAPVPLVLGNRGRLGQVVTNLLLNAAQALPDTPDPRQVVAVSTRTVGKDVLLAVEDSGPGVPADLRDRIFEPFFTTKPEGVGTGLGLALVAEIVAAHDGRIEVTSSNHGGAGFLVSFPSARGELAPPSGPHETPSSARARILLIDDEPSIVRLLMVLLAGSCTVVSATSGAEAIALLERDRAFDVVLCDLHMPGVDGIAVYEAVERMEPSLLVRFVFTTGGAVTARSRAFLDRVRPRVLAKPFPVEELFALLRQMTGG
jgi:signal transduction histidine kinase/CheY-like chemotaxis protein